MKIDPDDVLRLNPHGNLRLRDAQGTCIHVHWGELWITQEGDSRDRIVKTGESFEISNPGMTLLSALSAAGVSVLKKCRELGVAPAAGIAAAERRGADSVRANRPYPDVAEIEWHVEHAKNLRAAYLAEAVSHGWQALRRAVNAVRESA